MFHDLHSELSAVLVFVGTKMMLVDIYKIAVGVSLAVIAGILPLSGAVSLARPRPVVQDTPTPASH